MPAVIEPKVLKGFRDFLPEAELEKKRIRNLLEAVFESFGFVPIDTPVLEYSEVLLGKGGGESDKQMYRFNDNGGRDIAMRFDLTVPFARYAAAHRQELYLPFKRYHIAKVWRGENTQRGRYREFTQCDFDIVGCDTAAADFEILLVMQRSLRALGIEDLTIRFSHRGVFNRMLDRLGRAAQSAEILRIVDKLQKIGAEETRRLLETTAGVEAAAQVLEFIRAETDNNATLDKMSRLAGGPQADTRRLAEILSLLRELGIEGSFTLDPSITRGLDYYTGIVYESFLNDLPTIGSVCSGGRYDDLASLYSSERLPGVGSSIGLDRLTAALEELGRGAKRASCVDAIVFCMDEALMGLYQRIAERLREEGLSVEVYPENRRLNQQFAYAEKKNIPFAVFCSQASAVDLRDLVRRVTTENVPLAEAGAWILRHKSSEA